MLARVDNGSVAVSVSDHGPGISAEEQRVIFEKFGRAANAGSSSTPGAGLGLFIARSITEAHGGFARGRVAARSGRDVHGALARQRVLAGARRFLVSVFWRARARLATASRSSGGSTTTAVPR